MFPLDPKEPLIVIPTRVFGPRRQQILRFALDTGATQSVLNMNRAIQLEYNVDNDVEYARVTTASGVDIAPVITLVRLEALGKERRNIPVLCQTLPPSAGVDGVLGLDFFRGHRLTIDFRIGLVTLE